MTQKTVLFLSIVLSANVLLFQNCNPAGLRFQAESEGAPSSSPSPNSESNGQPYDGKIFVLLGAACSDGTLVQSRIWMKSATSAVLVRQNCQNINPVALSSSDFQLLASNPDQLIYQSKTYVTETPSVALSKTVTWNYQLTGTIQNQSIQIYDIDFQGADASTIASLKAAGHTVLCYIPAGAYEADRPDASAFLPSDIGNPLYSGSPDRWLDTRSANVRAAIMARLDLAKSKGCQGIDFDSVDAYTSNTGFLLTAATQMDFNQYLAFAAHDRGLIVALNNVPGLAKDLVNFFDLVITEQCFETGECASYQAFLDAGKPMLAAEYTALSSNDCSTAQASGISLTYFSSNLDGSRRQTCP